ncbi:MAG: hypothetical protein NWQ16_06495 [Akkermansiaceae bacterium]|nr:hypothetical protein [Akkermansiaceae bacterium]
MPRFSSTILIILSMARASAAQVDGDVFADSWVATDALGRSLPTFADVGPPRADRQVGLFYFLWVNQAVSNKNNLPVFNKSHILEKNPTNPKWGPPTSFHFWGEPEMGYYSIEDPFVLTKHRSMLTAAGIDTLLFDQTNALVYPNQMLKVCENLEQGRLQGLPVPKVAGIHNSKPDVSVPKLYETLYAPEKYKELWFHWLGKPLLLSNPETLSEGMKDYFTIRHTWAWSSAEWFGDGRDKWTWIDWFPQQTGWHESPDKPEQISVCIAPHPINARGRSHRGNMKTPPPTPEQLRTDEGIYAAQQWNRALQVDPPFILVTGWNEWIAQRQTWGKPNKPAKMGFLKLGEGDGYFVDQLNQEFSRDIEPMMGGHSDNYYYQLVSNVRRYKGVRPPVVPVIRPIAIDGSFDDWNDVMPEYRDFRGDTIHRDHLGWNKNLRYTNTTGRNDIVSAQVSADKDHVYFRVTCAEEISPSDGKAWMRLYIDVDQNFQTGWSGYDLIVNRSNPDSSGLSVHSIQNGATAELARISYAVIGQQLELALPRSLFGDAPELRFDFKWGDNQQSDDDVVDFALNGDAAPDRRFNYRYDQTVTEEKIRSWAEAAVTRNP